MDGTNLTTNVMGYQRYHLTPYQTPIIPEPSVRRTSEVIYQVYLQWNKSTSCLLSCMIRYVHQNIVVYEAVGLIRVLIYNQIYKQVRRDKPLNSMMRIMFWLVEEAPNTIFLCWYQAIDFDIGHIKLSIE